MRAPVVVGFGLPLALVLFAQVPPAAPSDYPVWLSSLFYTTGAVVLFIHGVNQTINLIQTIRGKQAVPPGQGSVTQSELDRVIEPLTDQLTRHERRDSDQFEKIEHKQDAMSEKVEMILRQITRLNTVLWQKGLHLKSDDQEGGE